MAVLDNSVEVNKPSPIKDHKRSKVFDDEHFGVSAKFDQESNKKIEGFLKKRDQQTPGCCDFRESRRRTGFISSVNLLS